MAANDSWLWGSCITSDTSEAFYSTHFLHTPFFVSLVEIDASFAMSFTISSNLIRGLISDEWASVCSYHEWQHATWPVKKIMLKR